MTTRESVLQIVNELSEEQLSDLLAYLAEFNDTDELSEETEDAVREGMEDIRVGRTISLDEYRRTRNL